VRVHVETLPRQEAWLATPMTPETFFEGQELARQLFDEIWGAITSIGEATVHVTKSQIAARRQKAFAWVWMPGKYLRGDVAPLVLTVGLRRRDASPRCKEIVEPVPGRYTHHLELTAVDEIDDEVRNWLREAWELAG
jgi:hypothetical protein